VFVIRGDNIALILFAVATGLAVAQLGRIFMRRRARGGGGDGTGGKRRY
jgi:hypothetical protein